MLRPFRQRKAPPNEALGEGFSPFRVRKCFACGQESKPRMTDMYKGILLGLTAAFFPLALFLPWLTEGARPIPAKLVAIGVYLFFVLALLNDRNGYRCRHCDGILN